MFKCFLFIVFTLYFKGPHTFRLIFDQFHIFVVPNFDNNFSKTCYFLYISKKLFVKPVITFILMPGCVIFIAFLGPCGW